MQSNPRNSLLLTLFADFGFHNVMHIVGKKINFQDNKSFQCKLLLASARNGLDYVYLNLIKPVSEIPSAFNLVQINHLLEAYEKFLHTCPAVPNALLN